MQRLPDFKEEKRLWRRGYQLVIGVDEVGRGAFAGPLVAGAVAFDARGPVGRFPHPMSSVDKLPAGTRRGSPTSTTPRYHNSKFIIHNSEFKIDDSKRLKPNQRKKAAKWIKRNCAAYGIGEASVARINKVGIGKATMLAMRKAIAQAIRQLGNWDARITQGKKINSPNNPFVLVDAFYVKYVRGIGLTNQKAIKKGDQKSISIAAASIIAKVFRDSLMQRFTKRYKKYHWGRNKGYGTRLHQEGILKNGITPLHRIQFVQTFLASKGEAFQS